MPVTPRPRTHSALALAVGLLALTACSGPDPAPPPSSAPPVFTSEEEALTAVMETYQRFQQLSYQILAEGGVGPERIRSLASDEVAETEMDGYRRAVERGYVFTGAPTIQSTALDLWLPHPDPLHVVARAELCLDISSVQVVDGAGTSVVSAERQPQSLWSVDISYRENDQTLIVGAKEKVDDRCDD